MQEKKIFIDEILEVDKNVLKYKDEAIQLSNISQIRIDMEPKQEYPLRYIVGLLFSLFCMITFRRSMWVALIFFCVAGIFAVLLYRINQYNLNLSKYLIIELNSGRLVLFKSDQDSLFLNKAMNVMIECFNDHGKHTIINFADCKIENSNIGDNGTVSSTYYRSARRDKERI